MTPIRHAFIVLALGSVAQPSLVRGDCPPSMVREWDVATPGSNDSARDLDLGGNGLLYVIANFQTVKVYGTDGTLVSSFGRINGENIAVAGNGRVFIKGQLTNPAQNVISVHDVSGGLVDTWGQYGTGAAIHFPARSIAADAAGDVYILESDRVSRFSVAGALKGRWGSEGSGPGQFDIPTELAVDSNAGLVYVYDLGSSRIQVFDTSGAYLREWSVPYGASYSLDVDDAGNVWAIGFHAVIYDAFGAVLQEWDILPEGHRESLALDDDGFYTMNDHGAGGSGEEFVECHGLGGPGCGPDLAVHVGPPRPFLQACKSPATGCGSLVTAAPADPGQSFYFVYVLASPPEHPGQGVGVVQMGLDYIEDSITQDGLVIYGTYSCADNQFPSAGWPSPGTGNSLIWSPETCPRFPVSPVVTLYVGAYGPSPFMITENPNVGDVILENCDNTSMSVPRSDRGWALFGGVDGCNPCIESCSDPAPLDVPASSAPSLALTAFPNPLGSSRGRIQYALDRSSSVNVVIHDVQGRRVRSLHMAVESAGEHELTWDRRDDSGRRVAGGSYVVRVRAGDRTQVRRWTLVD